MAVAEEPLKLRIKSTVLKVVLREPAPIAIKVGIPGVAGAQGPPGQQGAIGPQGPAGTTAIDYDIETDDDVVIGQPMYLKTPGGNLGLAQADGLPDARVFGLATEDQSSGVSVLVRAIGSVTRADWTAVTGSVSLSPGAVYYLDASTAGMLTATAPQSGGDFVTRVGIAATSTTLDIHPMRPIQKV